LTKSNAINKVLLMSSAAYQPVQRREEGGNISTNHNDDDDDDEEEEEDINPTEIFQDEHPNGNRIEPLELGSAYSDERDLVIDDRERLTTAKTTILWSQLALSVTLGLVTPVLISAIILAYCLLGRIWICLLFALHLTLALIKAQCHLSEIKSVVTEMTMTTTIDATSRTPPPPPPLHHPRGRPTSNDTDRHSTRPFRDDQHSPDERNDRLDHPSEISMSWEPSGVTTSSSSSDHTDKIQTRMTTTPTTTTTANNNHIKVPAIFGSLLYHPPWIYYYLVPSILYSFPYLMDSL